MREFSYCYHYSHACCAICNSRSNRVAGHIAPRRWPVDDAGKKLRRNALQWLDANHSRQRAATPAGLELLDRRARRPRRPHRRGRCRLRTGAVEDADRGHKPRRDNADGALRRRQTCDRRTVRRRVRDLRLGEGPRPRHRQDPLDRAQHGSRLVDARAPWPGKLRRRSEHRRVDLGRRLVAPRRRAGVGLDLLRPAARLDLFRHRESRPL